MLGGCVLLAACSGPSRWERSREAYCSLVESEGGRTEMWLRRFAGDVQRASSADPNLRFQACHQVQSDVRQIAARLDGFRLAAHVLLLGRDGEPIEATGIVTELGYQPLERYDGSACERGDAEGAVAHLREIGREASRELATALDRCRAIGYEPAGSPE